jgi:hypothetical protein
VKRFGGRFRLRAVALLGAVSAIVAWACADSGNPPTWALDKPDFDSGGSAAMLLPSNDTRVNLYLLLADRRGVAVRDPGARQESPPLALFPWWAMANAALPPKKDGDDSFEGSRCQTNASGAAAFAAALQANRAIPEPEKALLIGVRKESNSTASGCGVAALGQEQMSAIRSRDGQGYAAYLLGVSAFYAGEFDHSADLFRTLGDASDPWLRETGLYMVGRTLLNRAIERAIDEYGSLTDVDKRDPAATAAAGTALDAYLKAYPNGRYASSAEGLMRRVHWLAGDEAALAADYGRQLSSAARFAGAAPAVALVNEIDTKLPLPTNRLAAIRDPVLLAVVDLHRMRSEADSSARQWCCGPPISKAEIERQRPLFGDDTELYDYVRAAEAYFVRDEPGEVLEIIPDAARQQRFTYLQFSRQMLRGMALDAIGDRNAHGFWLSLFPAATQAYQREAVELALALHYEHRGRLDLVFAPGSPVRHPVMRELLLEHVAGPDILRRQASRADVPRQEREVALYMLLSKELRRGFYRDFLEDLKLLPADAPADTYFGGAMSYDVRWSPNPERPPLGKFGPAAQLGDFGCPALAVTAAQLAADSQAIRPRLCLAEFFRNNDFDGFNNWYGFDEPVRDGGLASSKPLFPAGTPYARLEVYKAIIADPRASADDRALALNRAVRCYAPGGNNSCSGTEVELAQRRAWYFRLKRQYPGSRWARDLKYYW